MYKEGRGVPEDRVRAYLWFSLAAAQTGSTDRDAITSQRDAIAREMSPAEIAQAKSLVIAWKPQSSETHAQVQ
jgi:uncharacterized protein